MKITIERKKLETAAYNDKPTFEIRIEQKQVILRPEAYNEIVKKIEEIKDLLSQDSFLTV